MSARDVTIPMISVNYSIWQPFILEILQLGITIFDSAKKLFGISALNN